MTLHDELAQLADTAPRPSIDHTVWDRGRALRRRDRIVASAVVLALVVIVGGLASLIIGPPRAVGPADDPVPGGAIPSRIYDVPASVTGPLESDLAIGRASVVFMSSGGIPVVITATDGRYHFLDLPGWTSNGPLALSPRGNLIAWESREDPSDPSIAILDLTTGLVTPGARLGSADIRTATIAWSPNSQRLASIATEQGFNPLVATWDRKTDRGRSTKLEIAGGPQFHLAIANDGSIAAGSDETSSLVSISPSGEQTVVPLSIPGSPAQFSPSGDMLALFTGRGDSSATWEIATGKVVEHPFPDDTFDNRVVRPLGWLDDRLQLLAVYEVGGNDAELVITTPEVNDTSTWRRSVGSLGRSAVGGTFAVDLIPDLDGTSSQRLTHDFGEPEWPGQRDISWIVGLGVAAAVAVLLGLRWLWRRRAGLL